MALTPLQSKVLRLLAENRRKTPGSYVAGGTAFNLAMNAPRLSRDVDVFHDSTEAMLDSWRRDRQTLEVNGFTVKPLRELPTFIEARILHAEGTTEIQWGIDSAYRFFPLVEREDTGFTLHPLDLASNKLAALVGRTEPRDWIDVITASKRLQPFACLLSAACGKDPGFSPISMLEYVARRHYNQTEIDDNIMPRGIFDAAELCRYWHEMVERTKRVLEVFPHAEAGKAVMTAEGELFNGTDDELVAALKAGSLTFHEGHIGGAWPRIIR
jgi:hypothetical protein